MRSRSSAVVVALALFGGGCSAIDNFGKFTFDGGAASGACTPGCTCIPANTMLGVPAHCAVAPANSVTCSNLAVAADVTLSGTYTLDTSLSPPELSGPGLSGALMGSVEGSAAVFCVGSLVTDSTTTINVQGNRPLTLVAASLIQLDGVLHAGGVYASDEHGRSGTAGGAGGGDSAMMGNGPAGGKSGGGSGAGGGGGGNAVAGFAGGGTMNASNTPGGDALPTPNIGSGGGGGGSGNSKGGGGGGGGGFVQLSASYMIKLGNAGIDVTGGGGAGGFPSIGSAAPGTGGGGGGGGAGGIIVLDAPTVSVDNGCLSVLGGPGGEGGGATLRGRDNMPKASCPFNGGPIGLIMPGAGGAGGFPSANGVDAAGKTGIAVGGGGGGTGGAGRVIVRARTQPTNLPGTIVAPNGPQSYEFIALP